MAQIGWVNSSSVQETVGQTAARTACAVGNTARDLQNTYKIKLRDAEYRLVYEVIEQRLVIVVMAVGRRDHDEVYLAASKRRNA